MVDHPGVHLRAELDRRGWNQSDLIFVLGCLPKTVNLIINCKQGISPQMSKALGHALGLPLDHFSELQKTYDLFVADDPDPVVSLRSKLQAAYPIRDMIKRGWLSESASGEVLAQQVTKFFGVAKIDDVPHIAHAAKRTDYDEIPAAQLAWLFRVRQIAKEMTPPAFDRAKLEEALEELAELRAERDAVRHVPRLLHTAGVRFVVVESLPGGKIDGVCLWLNSVSPVIGMSLRFDRIDNFWFVLRHECSHVLHGHGKDAAIVDAELQEQADSNVSEEERIANMEGAEFCVPQDKMQSFYLRKKPFFSEREVMAFAKRVRVHPGLVVGQLQRMTSRYDLMRRHLVKVREMLANAMMMDGWGDVVPIEM